jgi:hypothetical protein
MEKIREVYGNLEGHYENVENDYNIILKALEQIRDIDAPSIKDSYEKINSLENINGWTVEERNQEIFEDLNYCRSRMNLCFSQLYEYEVIEKEEVVREILIPCQIGKYEYLTGSENCYGFDIDHVDRAENLLCYHQIEEIFAPLEPEPEPEGPTLSLSDCKLQKFTFKSAGREEYAHMSGTGFQSLADWSSSVGSYTTDWSKWVDTRITPGPISDYPCVWRETSDGCNEDETATIYKGKEESYACNDKYFTIDPGGINCSHSGYHTSKVFCCKNIPTEINYEVQKFTFHHPKQNDYAHMSGAGFQSIAEWSHWTTYSTAWWVDARIMPGPISNYPCKWKKTSAGCEEDETATLYRGKNNKHECYNKYFTSDPGDINCLRSGHHASEVFCCKNVQ